MEHLPWGVNKFLLNASAGGAGAGAIGWRGIMWLHVCLWTGFATHGGYSCRRRVGISLVVAQIDDVLRLNSAMSVCLRETLLLPGKDLTHSQRRSRFLPHNFTLHFTVAYVGGVARRGCDIVMTAIAQNE